MAPGDLVLGDDDGVVIVPLGWCDEVLLRAFAHMGLEKDWMAEIEAGRTISEMFDVPTPQPITMSSA